ncbi:MAG: S-layer homology domain-containing protein [Clostridia bacterium]|nr:S-layer homology domain-containing protein [Clostridia bacterium]
MRTVIRKLTLIVLTVSLLCVTAFAADNTAPALTMSEESGSTLEGGSPITLTVEDENKVSELTYYWKGGSETVKNPNTNKVTVNLRVGTQAGKYVFCVNAVDSEGNSTGEKSYIYYVASTDEEAPALTMSEESGSTLEAGSLVTLTVEDESKISEVNYYWKGGTEKTITPNTNKVTVNLRVGTQAGKYILYVNAVDAEGNATGEKAYTYYVPSTDEDAPEITVSEESGSTLAGGTQIVVNVSDESKISEVKYYWKGNSEKTLTPNTNSMKLTLSLGTQSGKYVLYLRATDAEGNDTGEKTYIYYVAAEDGEAPVITLNKESGSTLPGGTIINVKIEDESKIAEVTYNWAGNTEKVITPNTNTVNLNLTLGTQGGKYILYVTAKDAEGNSTEKQAYTFYVESEDKDAPAITVTPKDGATVAGGSAVAVRVEDESKISKITYNWAGNTEKAITPNTNITTLNLKVGTQSGKYILYVTAEDEKGNSTEKQVYTFYVEGEDNEAPVITVTPENGATVAGGSAVTVKVEDENKVAEVAYYWAGNTEKVITPNTNITTLNLKLGTQGGKYILYVTAKDSKGNSTGKRTYTFYVDAEDNEAPVITASEKDGSILPAGAKIVLKASDDGKIAELKYQWSGLSEKTLNPYTNDVTVNLVLGTEPGKYILKASAKDDSNNSNSEVFTFYVDGDNEAPTVTVSPKGGSTVEAGDIVVAIPEDNEALSKIEYYWDNNTPQSKNISGTYVRVDMPAVPEKAGEHILHVKVTDAAGNTTDWKTYTYYVKANENEFPTISVNPEHGSTITPDDDVKVTVKDKEGLAEIEYAWDNDTPVAKAISGTEKTLTMPSIPNKPGKHTLHVTVTDEDGAVTVSDFDFYVPEEDDEAPTITMNPVSKTTVVGGKIIKATLRDNVELEKVEYYWDDDDAETKLLSGALKTISLPAISKKPGTYYMHIKLTDAAGNTTGWEKHIYYVEDDDDGDGEDPEVFADPDGGDVEYGDRITLWAEDKDGIEYIEYYWDDDDDDTTIKYSDEFTVKVPSDEGKHYLYVRAMDEVGDMCGWERFVYNIEENNYPGNPDITGDVNKRVKNVRVEIRNADDKIKFEPEEEILYYVDYYNGSSSKLTNAKLVVDLPTYLEAKKASDDGKITTKQVTWSLGTLKAGESGRVSFKAEYTSDKYNEKIITVPAKIYSGSSLKDTSTVRNLIYCDDGTGTGFHSAYCIGYPDGSFRANGNITRAELAQMIANIEGLRGTYRGQFSDVPKDHWAASAIQACVDKGYVLSVGFNNFAPERPATRGELAYAIAAALGVQDLEPIFIASSDLENSDFRCSMEQLLRLGIMDGYSNGTARPNASITRAEAVTIINNYLFRGELIVSGYGYGHTYNYDTNYNYGGNGTVLSFTDLSTGHWAYGHIMEATNNHKYERILDGNERML